MPGRCRRWAKVGVPEVIDIGFEDMDTPTDNSEWFIGVRLGNLRTRVVGFATECFGKLWR